MIIAVDFDGTLQFADRTPNRILFRMLRQNQRNGDIVILWTCRSGKRLMEAVQFCLHNGLKFNYVNQNAPQAVAALGYDSRKIYADLYIDDRSLALNKTTEQRAM